MTIQLPALPENFAVKLPQLSAIRLSGEEQVKYLQGQVTCDVTEHQESKLTHGAHCDAKGKVLSVFRLVEHKSSLLLIQPKLALETSLAELKKFGVFAKVDIEQAEDLSFALVHGDEAAIRLKNTFGALPDELTPVIHHQALSLAYLAGQSQRYLLIAADNLLDEQLSGIDQQGVDEKLWDLLEIVEGFPMLTPASIQHYVPQMLNLDKIHGISFTKGCYLGQETVARMQYLGKNKKMMALLVGQVDTLNQAPTALEKQLGENWRSAGDIINCYHADNGTLYVQAVISNEITGADKLRIKGLENTSLTLAPLAYISA